MVAFADVSFVSDADGMRMLGNVVRHRSTCARDVMVHVYKFRIIIIKYSNVYSESLRWTFFVQRVSTRERFAEGAV